MLRILFVLMGHLSLGIGVVGVFLPILPTTPFVLLAAYLYSRGSQRFHDWLQNHPRFGPILTDWWGHGVIRPRAKWIATWMILATLSYPVVFLSFYWGLKLAAGLVGCCVLTFIHSRPSQPRTERETNSQMAA